MFLEIKQGKSLFVAVTLTLGELLWVFSLMRGGLVLKPLNLRIIEAYKYPHSP